VSGRRLWGWHRLDPYWARQIVANAAIRPGELVVDLGVGTSALTLPLVKAGARVIAVELHARRARQLRATLNGYAASVVDQGRRDLRRFHTRRGLPIPRNAFLPPSPVDSAVLQIRRLRGSRNH
jgi:23S rRNA (adenine-N6)-dimethyltransferase